MRQSVLCLRVVLDQFLDGSSKACKSLDLRGNDDLGRLAVCCLGKSLQALDPQNRLIGACLGFIPFNFNPAKIFMGDVGSQFLGFILATVSILGLFKLQTVLTFALPLADTGFAVIRRLAHGQSPFHADKGHFHHRLMALGLSQKQTVLVLYGVAAIGGVVSLWIAGRGPVIRALCIVAIVVTLIGIGILVFIRNPRRAKAREERKKQRMAKKK